jgi:hypothetical protein
VVPFDCPKEKLLEESCCDKTEFKPLSQNSVKESVSSKISLGVVRLGGVCVCVCVRERERERERERAVGEVWRRIVTFAVVCCQSKEFLVSKSFK